MMEDTKKEFRIMFCSFLYAMAQNNILTLDEVAKVFTLVTECNLGEVTPNPLADKVIIANGLNASNKVALIEYVRLS